MQEVDVLSPTKRDKQQGSGSTGIQPLQDIITKDIFDKPPPTAAAAVLKQPRGNITTTWADDINDHTPYNVVLSDDPLTDNETITIPVRGKHITNGLLLQPWDVFKDRIVINRV